MTDPTIDFSSRDALAGVSDAFSRRWSPRVYLPSPVAENDLQIIFDAARWSPSCYNEQPWLFITSTDKTHDKFVGLLVEANQKWAKQAPVIGFVIAAKQFARNGKENAHAAFDTGAAWMAVNLQANMLGLHTHGMAGIDYEKVYETLNVNSDTHRVICGFTIGYLDQSGNEDITTRKALSEIWQQNE
jgi:nitroreductase